MVSRSEQPIGSLDEWHDLAPRRERVRRGRWRVGERQTWM
ncbi:MAG: hypothetical protein AVDCRST_MAG77-3104 [uncultured Chloroflexi bacterium]|uniref:Uncharacterized protein n=1 Tax=uncultured Chloroflexota bacterium TaxID=166587 RepID=A0A6J4J7Y4_9CHLR|nr:MAG: hypothetical protein AVDCRST_MAG77-3104 [uncultured Chloroflexota bacterium]